MNAAVRPDDRPEASAASAATVSDRSRPAPDTPVIFFDGVCGLCNRSVDFVLARDRRRVFRFAPLQGETARAWLDPADVRDLNSLVVVDRAGVHRRSSAVVRILRRLGGFWAALGGLLWIIPRPLRNLGYRAVARYRYRLFGKKETCRMPSADERALFLP